MESPTHRRPYPSDVSDEEWTFGAPHLTLMTPDAPQRTHDLREVSNALSWIVRTGAQWRPKTVARFPMRYTGASRAARFGLSIGRGRPDPA